MSRIVCSKARKIIERDRTYYNDRPVVITDEELYHHLLRTERFRDMDYTLRMVHPLKLQRLKHGSVVTIIREMGLGDVLMVAAVMRALKNRFSALRFRLVTARWYLPILRDIDFLDGVEALMDLQGIQENCVDLRGIPERHPKHDKLERIDIFAEHLGIRVHDYTLPIAPVTKEERARARELIGWHPTIALAVRGSTHVRTWPIENVQRFAELAAARGWGVAVLDNQPHEMPWHPKIKNLTGQIGIADVKAIIAESVFCISPDSGLQHVAEAVGTKCLALYSTTPPSLRISHYQHVKALWRESLPCVPCFDRGCAPAPCMRIAPEAVLRGIENWDLLAKSTNIDASGLAPAIKIAREFEIMATWPGAHSKTA